MLISVIPLASVTSLVYASLLEWCVHRFGYHDAHVWRAATSAHRLHHEVRYPEHAFFEREGDYETSQPFWLEALYVALHAPVLLALGIFSPAAALTAGSVIALYAALAHYVHPLTHLRTGLPYERTRLWKRLVARHVRHHHEQQVNFNVLLPIGDLVFGTRDARGRGKAARALAAK
jgi:hypothetical protein